MCSARGALVSSALVPIYFRKSIGAGPFRVNLSRSGVGYSVGAKGFRVGQSARGRRYTSFGIPGTGVRVSKSFGRGCAGVVFLGGLGVLGVGLAVPVIMRAAGVL